MLSGVLPFDDDNKAELRKMIGYSEPSEIHGLDESIDFLVKGLLMKDPKKRLNI